MSTEISPLQSITEKIRDRIKDDFVSLMPDEMWNGMVQGVLSDFITEPKHGNGYSPLKMLIRTEVEKKARDSLAAYFSKLCQPGWDTRTNEQTISDELKKMIDKHFTEILAGVQKGIVESASRFAIESMRNAMQRGY